jgi:hypothetical protein
MKPRQYIQTCDDDVFYSFLQKQKIGAVLHIYLEEGTYLKKNVTVGKGGRQCRERKEPEEREEREERREGGEEGRGNVKRTDKKNQEQT